MEWDSSLEIGIEKIDQQHKVLVEKVVEFMGLCEKRMENTPFDSILAFLEDYVVKHFADEEEMQTACGYPKYSSHKKLHAYFVQDFLDVEARIDEEGLHAETLSELKRLLIDWLVEHISGEDMEFGRYYNSTSHK